MVVFGQNFAHEKFVRFGLVGLVSCLFVCITNGTPAELVSVVESCTCCFAAVVACRCVWLVRAVGPHSSGEKSGRNSGADETGSDGGVQRWSMVACEDGERWRWRERERASGDLDGVAQKYANLITGTGSAQISRYISVILFLFFFFSTISPRMSVCLSICRLSFSTSELGVLVSPCQW